LIGRSWAWGATDENLAAGVPNSGRHPSWLPAIHALFVECVSPPDPDKQDDPADPSPSATRRAEVSQLFRDHNRALVLFLTSRLKDPQAAREVAQEAYVRLLQLQTPAAVSFLRSYLFKIAANLAIDRQRHERTRARLDLQDALDDFLDDGSPERTALARDELTALGRLIAELPAKYQEAFRLHRVEDAPFEDIARRMGLKDRMVRRYVSHTLLYLRLRREGVTAQEAWRQVQS